MTPVRAACAAALTAFVAGIGACDRDSAESADTASTSPAPAPAPAPAQAGDCRTPYTRSSPWNTPVPRGAPRARREATYLGSLEGSALTSDPSQYTYPVYSVGPGTPRERVELSGFFSHVSDGGRRLEFRDEPTLTIPIPKGAVEADGDDAQIILVHRRTGEEWGFFRADKGADGVWRAENGYHYDVDWDGVPPPSENGNAFGSRGAGVPYLAGLVRPCEIARGRIDHALAFAYDHPSRRHVFPATKSDGIGSARTDLPEGSRLQLDPTLGADEIGAWGCDGPCLVIARALQRYGMYVIDNAGRPKVMLEYEGTAGWGDLVDDDTVSPIPFSAFRVIAPCTRVGTVGNDEIRGTRRRDVLCGRDGDDRLLARGGADVAYGGTGADLLRGGPGADRLFGERGNDRLIGGRGRDRLFGGPGRDRRR